MRLVYRPCWRKERTPHMALEMVPGPTWKAGLNERSGLWSLCKDPYVAAQLVDRLHDFLDNRNAVTESRNLQEREKKEQFYVQR